MQRLAAAARAARATDLVAATVETLLVPTGQHSWLYEFAAYRRAVALFVTEALGGPLTPAAAGRWPAAVPATRIPDAEGRFAATEDVEGGMRTLAKVVLPGGDDATVSLDGEAPGEP